LSRISLQDDSLCVQDFSTILGRTTQVAGTGAWIEASPELRRRLQREVDAVRLLAPAVLHGARLLRGMNAASAAATDEGRLAA
jgi:hypothetical protein